MTLMLDIYQQMSDDFDVGLTNRHLKTLMFDPNQQTSDDSDV